MSEYTEKLENELAELKNIEDEATDMESLEAITRYDITSYGIDFDIEGLVKRIKRGDIFIPDFQRNFVWKLAESSRFIESLLLGLPVPGIFLAQEQDTGKMLVIDGQQRLLSLLYFFEGIFNPTKEQAQSKKFKLEKVQPQFVGKTYETLDPKERIDLGNCVIHATVVKQDLPTDDDTSIYHVYERLNSGGRKLTPQEIRTAVFHGKLLENINSLNNYPNWRKIYGKANERMKDEELILRFFSMLEAYETYKPPMTEFISLFCKKHRNDKNGKIEEYSNLFKQCCDLFVQVSNGRPFRLAIALNVAFFEAAMIGLAYAIKNNNEPTIEKLQSAYDSLKSNKAFISVISQSTGNQASLKQRIELAIQVFA
jgi:uncharacterized protein with ParB-like and HNH nuclease domain